MKLHQFSVAISISLQIIWIGNNIPQKYIDHLRAYAQIAKENKFELNLWVDKKVEKFLENLDLPLSPFIKIKNIDALKSTADLSIWNCINREKIGNVNYAAAADMIRLLILKKEGGYYFDIDLVPPNLDNTYKISLCKEAELNFSIENSRSLTFPMILKLENNQFEILTFPEQENFGSEKTGIKSKEELISKTITHETAIRLNLDDFFNKHLPPKTRLGKIKVNLFQGHSLSREIIKQTGFPLKLKDYLKVPSIIVPNAPEGFLCYSENWAFEVDRRETLNNCALAATPNHPIVERCLGKIVENYKKLDQPIKDKKTEFSLMDYKRINSVNENHKKKRMDLVINNSGPRVIFESVEDYRLDRNGAEEMEGETANVKNFAFPLINDNHSFFIEMIKAKHVCDQNWVASTKIKHRPFETP